MQELEWQITGGILLCRRHETGRENYIEIIGYRGQDSALEVPGEIDGLPVREIAKKAFLSQKDLRRVRLPETLERLGDWAFAYCDGLETVQIPASLEKLGRSVFLECGGLRQIVPLSDVKGKNNSAEHGAAQAPGTDYLLAAAAGPLDAYYLLDLSGAGRAEWLTNWDARLMTVLRASDREGYSKMLLCGEEDYGSRDTDLGYFLSQKRKKKVRLVLLRLRFHAGLTQENRWELEEYLRAHTKNCDSEEAWEVIREEYGELPEYYRVFLEIGGLSADNIGAALEDLGAEHTQMKAAIMRYQEQHMEKKDFFEGLEL